LTTYNDYRKHYGMKKKTSFKDLVGDKNTELAQKMQEVYGDIDSVEWFVGIWAEDYDEKTNIMGGLLINMVANDAFTQILTNPLLSKQVFNKDTFSKEGFAIIKETSKVSDIIGRNSGIKNDAAVTFNLKASRRTAKVRVRRRDKATDTPIPCVPLQTANAK
jgi:prostaglandin-endoperoxide synthase 2